MKEQLTVVPKIFIQICESLPFGATLFEVGGCCSVQQADCSYVQKALDNKSKLLCKKKTYTPLHQPITT